MMRASLRIFAVAALALVLATPAAAAGKMVDASKVFARLDAYLKLPPAERSHFTMAYYLRVGDAPLTAPAWLVEGDRKTAIPLRADGRILRLPTAAQLGAAKVEIGVDAATKVNENIGLEPLAAPAQDLDARELAIALAQAQGGMRKIAGPMGFALSTPKAILFVGAQSGEAELADGKRVPLPMIKGAPAYDPAALANAKRIHLARTPQKLDID
ncbi:hypothetical protein [Phenylobacterium sp.]|uniref:hypothetical protein n=1 Tax=Phenylobacterium sp. TaxID=1871053 RepID=UPI003563CF9A